MTFTSPGAVILSLGPLSMRWYGLLYGLGFLVALAIAEKYLCPKEIDKEELSNFFISVLIFGIIGARLWYVLLNLDYYSVHPLETVQIWLGGQSIQGGIIGGVLGSWFIHRSFYLHKLAIAATVVPIAQAIARWGNFFNEEAYGGMTDLPWKLYISHTGTYHHPCFLYESIWNLLSFVVLFKTYDADKPLKSVANYLLLYSIGRLMIEQLRLDQIMLWDFVSAGTLMAVVGILVGVSISISQKTLETLSHIHPGQQSQN